MGGETRAPSVQNDIDGSRNGVNGGNIVLGNMIINCNNPQDSKTETEPADEDGVEDTSPAEETNRSGSTATTKKGSKGKLIDLQAPLMTS